MSARQRNPHGNYLGRWKKNALLNTSPHCWLDGLEALAWCLLVSATHAATTLGGVPSVLLFTCHTSPSTYVWPTSNHPSSDWPILPYVQNPYSPASLRSHGNIMQSKTSSAPRLCTAVPGTSMYDDWLQQYFVFFISLMWRSGSWRSSAEYILKQA